MNSAKKMYMRGWSPNYKRETKATSSDGAPYTPIQFFTETEKRTTARQPGHDSSEWLYIWVAEAPTNAEQKQNPHVHVLMNWTVPWPIFPQWCRKIEQLWGNGFAHAEKIRSKNAAGEYILKAINYVTKGSNAQEQGTITGNRYNISRAARAPGWEHVYSMAIAKWQRHIEKAKHQHSQHAKKHKTIIANLTERLSKTNNIATKMKRKIKDAINKAKQNVKKIGFITNQFSIIFFTTEHANAWLHEAITSGATIDQRPPNASFVRELEAMTTRRARIKQARQENETLSDTATALWFERYELQQEGI
jgi:hypothetical protein